MKKRISKFLYILVALALIVSSCEWEPIMWDDSKVFIAFSSSSTDMLEDGDNIGIVVALSALDGSPAVTVSFEFDTVGIEEAKAAFEGDQFTLVNDSKTLNFPDGWGYDTIWIDPIGNDFFSGNKQFNIQLVSNSGDLIFGALNSHAVKIVDNEHPLSAWIGTYEVDAQSYGDPENWDEAWAVTTAAVEGELDKLSILGIGTAGTTAIIATIDAEAMTITINGGQDSDAYSDYGYTESYVYYGFPDLSLDESAPLVGTISEDGTIAIDNFGIRVEYFGDDYGVWDVFNTTWTKTAKKAVSRSMTIDKAKANKH